MNYICMDEKLNSELKLDIFSRLPVESVIRCRCVSKSWCSILNDPHFVHMHTQKLLLDQDEDDQKNEHSMSFVTGNVVNGLKIVRAMRVVNLVVCSYIETKSIIMESSFSTFLSKDDGNVDIVGSCNGLVCLLRGNSHMILNPVTKEILFIPYDSKINYEKDDGVSDGFGYHPSTKEYKIVSHRIYDDQSMNETISSVQVYTLGSGSRWRNVIEMSNYDLDYSSVHINGVLYWITPSSKRFHHRSYCNETKMLMSFDLAAEEYRIVTPLPAPSPFEANPVFQLGEWGRGCLCLIAYYHEMSKSYADIWVMKKNSTDSDNYSWNKVTETITLGSEGGSYRYAALAKSGKVLFWNMKSILTCFDPKTNSFAPLSTRIQFPGRQISGVQHMKSFVSLKALGEENAERYIGETREYTK